MIQSLEIVFENFEGCCFEKDEIVSFEVLKEIKKYDFAEEHFINADFTFTVNNPNKPCKSYGDDETPFIKRVQSKDITQVFVTYLNGDKVAYAPHWKGEGLTNLLQHNDIKGEMICVTIK